MPDKLETYHRKRDFNKTGEPEGKPQGSPNGKPNGSPEGSPEGSPAGRQSRLRFVVQHHFARREHYDFRLEWNGTLLSWAVPKGPSYNPRDRRLAVEVEDHPVEYGDFEGTIPKGEYGGGTVMLWDEGVWEPLADVEEGRRAGALKFALAGSRLQGKWTLVRTQAKPGEDDRNWLLIKEKDHHVLDHDGISQYTESVRTGRTRQEIEQGKPAQADSMPSTPAAKSRSRGQAAADKASADSGIRNPFDQTDVMLATLVPAVPAYGTWLYEMKYDGYRIIAYLDGDGVKLITRNGLDYTSRFQRIADSLADWAAGRTLVLDGEVMVRDAAGFTNFQALQNYMRDPHGKDIVYIVFDLLALHGADLRNSPIQERKAGLEALLADAPADIHYSAHISTQAGAEAERLFQAACQAHQEGLVGKKADSLYSGTRNGDWIKIKCGNRQEFVIGGYTVSSSRTGGFSSLLLGVYEGGGLIYAGRAGTGFSAPTFQELEGKFADIKIPKSPFKNAPDRRSNETITWLKPVLVAEVEFAGWTNDSLLRQASFQGIRTDKDPTDVVREIPRAVDETPSGSTSAAGTPKDGTPLDGFTGEGERPGEAHHRGDRFKGEGRRDGRGVLIGGVRITSPDKRMIEGTGIAKQDIARYYASVYPRMIPFLRRRLLSVVRCPDGTTRPCYYHKHPDPDAEGIVRMPVREDSGKTEDYFHIDSLEGLLHEAQMGTIEFHTWGSRVDSLEKPDVMVFDLDPGEGLDIERVRQGVRDLKSILDELDLESFLKTSGGKGYHVVIPLDPAAGWEAIHEYARLIARVMEQRWPSRYTGNIRKVRRQGKVFIDWLRNSRTATSVAPYSIRARAGAPVSMPIAWDELDTVRPNGIDVKEALARMDGKDPWADFYRVSQRIKG